MVSSSELMRIMVCKYLVIGLSSGQLVRGGAAKGWRCDDKDDQCRQDHPDRQIPQYETPSSGGRHADRLQPRMRTGAARFHPVEIRAHVVPRQVQHLAPELPIFLDLRLALRRSASEFAVCIA